MNVSKEQSIRNIGIYFLVFGFICACIFFSRFGPVVPLCVILICAPRLMYNSKIWASALLMICSVLTTLALLFSDGFLVLLSHEDGRQIDVSGVIIIGVLTVIALLSCYLCFNLSKLLFKK